jgi:putative transposase
MAGAPLVQSGRPKKEQQRAHMPRPRYEIADVPQHVVQRGNDRQRTFADDRDYEVYLRWLAQGLQRYRCDLHAYVLMANHVHLLITPRVPRAISRVMQLLGSRYVRHYNARHGRTGTLWEGRHWSSLVASGRYFMTCSRYIELNPVRAGLVQDPAAFRWSSYQHNALAHRDLILTPHPEYAELGDDPAARAASYRLLFEDALDEATLEDIRTSARESRAFGSEAFKDEIERRLARPVRRLRPGRRPSPENYCSERQFDFELQL